MIEITSVSRVSRWKRCHRAVEDKWSVLDLHATILRQLGLDQDWLWFPRLGREETLTDSPIMGAKVVHEIVT